MNAYWFYPIHLVAFVGGIALLTILRHRGVAWSSRAAVGGILCAMMAVFGFQISEPAFLFADFYKAYYPAAQAVLAEDGPQGLAQSMRQGAGGFVNLPVLAYLFAPFALLPSAAAGSVFFLLGVLATLAACLVLSRLAGLDRDRSLILLFLFAACGPLHNSLREGNTTHFILLLLVLGIWMLRRKQDFAAGLIFGFAALIKLPLLLLGIYFVARGRWRVGMGGASIGLLAGLASIGIFGWDLHLHWYEHSIKPFAETPMAAFNVQSVQGFIARLQHGGLYLLNWDPHPLDPALRRASSLTVMFLMLTAAAVIAWPRRWRRGNGMPTPASAIIELEVCIVILVAMMTSTVSWSHYYLWMLLPAGFLLGGTSPVLTLRGIRIPGWAAILGALPPVIFVKTSHPVLGKVYGYFAVSHYLLAAGLLLVVLLVADFRTRPSETGRSD